MKKNYKNIFSLRGKNALITGAAGFLGKYLAQALADFGANLILVDRKVEDVERLAKAVQPGHKVKVLRIACDISDPEAVFRMMLKIERVFKSVHILFNHAATRSDNPLDFFSSYENYSLEQWRKVMSVNIDAMFLVSQAVGKNMIRNKIPGSIIQTSSIYGVLAPDQRIYKGSRFNTPAVYTTSKAAVIGLTKHLATLWAGHGIRVNALIPGGVENEHSNRFVHQYSSRVPMGRMARPDEIVGASVFLASDASSYVTGHCLLIDGGLSAW